MIETNNLTRAPEGSIDALAKALGLIADQSGETMQARPWTAGAAPEFKTDTDLRIEVIAARIFSLEKGLSLVQAQLTRAEDWQARMEKSFGLLQETIRTEFQTASRIVLGAVGGLAVMLLIGHWI